MAGTSDARKIIKSLSKGNVSVLATATTSHGTDLAQSSGASKVLEGYFNSDQLVRVIEENSIQILIDATHPFASLATQNAIIASEKTGIEYVRFERPPSDLPDSELIHKCYSFEEATRKILEIKKEDLLEKNQVKGKILHLAGVNTLHHLTNKISPHFIVIRTLPAVYSIEKCLKLGIPHGNIVAMEGIFSPKFNRILMEEYQIEIILTKESGDSGGVMSKIKAALDLNIPVVIVMRPEIKKLQGKKVFDDLSYLCDEIISNKH